MIELPNHLKEMTSSDTGTSGNHGRRNAIPCRTRHAILRSFYSKVPRVAVLSWIAELSQVTRSDSKSAHFLLSSY
jgi:hypothetical protein